MRAVIQRVLEASVSINNQVFSKIDNGLLVFLGIEENDNKKYYPYLNHRVIKNNFYYNNYFL